MKTIAAVVAAAAACASVVSGSVTYTGDKLMRFRPRNELEYQNFYALVERLNLDVWRYGALDDWTDVRVPQSLLPAMRALNFPAEVLMDDIQTVINSQQKAHTTAQAEFFEEYQTWDAINDWINTTVAAFPSIASYFTIGKTYEGNDITGIKLSGSGSTGKRAVVFNGGQHAREWITVATVTGIANEIVSNSTYYDDLDFYVIPVLNPDGYKFTWSDDRLWRKNRQPAEGSVCLGTDVNRNWGYEWNTGGSSNSPCSDTFHGEGPFSTYEASALDQYLQGLQADGIKVEAYIDFHSYSQLLLSPWGFTCAERTADYDLQMATMGGIAAAIQGAGYGTRYTYGPICTTIYQASGGSIDHTYGVLDIAHSYAFELRDTGRYGFLLPEDQIQPSIIETYAGFQVLLDEILSK